MKRENIILLIGYAIMVLFIYTALSKLFAYSIYLSDLRRSPELGAFAVPISILIPGTELISAIFILIPAWRKIGFLVATILMIAFTLYVSYVLLFAQEQPCTCGGIIRELTWKQHLSFNIFFTILAAIAFRSSSKTVRSQEQKTSITT